MEMKKKKIILILLNEILLKLLFIYLFIVDLCRVLILPEWFLHFECGFLYLLLL